MPRRGRMLALGGLLPAAGVLYGVVARPRMNQWGATDQAGLLFWQPPIALGAVVDGVLLRALIGSRRPRRLAAGGRRRR